MGHPGGHGSSSTAGIEKRTWSESKGTLKKIFQLLSGYKIGMVTVIILAFLTVFMQVVSPFLLGQFTNIIAAGIQERVGGTISINTMAMSKVLVALAITYVLNALLNYLQNIILIQITESVIYDLRKDIQHKLRFLPLSYFDGNSLGDILSRVTNDVTLVSNSLQDSLPSFFTSLLTLVMVFIGMLSLSPWLTLVALVTLPLSALVTMKIAKFSQGFFRGQQEGMGKIGGYVEEMFTGHSVIRAYGQEENVIADFDDINQELYQNSRKAQFASGLMMPISAFFSNIGYVAVAIVGCILVFIGKMVVGGIQTFISYLRMFSQPISQLANMMTSLQSSIAAAERVFEFLEEEEEPKDVEFPKTIDDPKGQVDFDHIRFGYHPENPLIKDLTLHCKSGDTIAIVGPTGAGKTTLVNLLLRFYDVQGGQILIDGVDIQELRRKDLRSMFGMVLQDTWLFHGTIMENIRYGRLNATDEEVLWAAKNSFVDDFIRTLPEGYNTMIDEDSGNISGGQRQLLTIARALLSDPAILILDEATSSVDTRTEKLIQKAMQNLMEGRTSFVIAHRLSTIRDSEVIMVLNHGDIVETGNHKELLQQNGFYAQLYHSQLIGSEEL